MNRPRKSKQPTEPRRTAAISTGQFVSGSLFRLVREIRGSAYSVGDQFMLLDEADCHDPNILKLGGTGETFFIDPAGKPLKIEAGDKQIDSIFEFVQDPQQIVEESCKEPPSNNPVTESEMKRLAEELHQSIQEIRNIPPVPGPKGDRGEPGGVKGPKGDRGIPGLRGKQGKMGERGPRGLKGERGARGAVGAQGKVGPEGKIGPKGLKGDKGDRGEKGNTGDSGILSAKFPLVYDSKNKTVGIDEARLDSILKRILSGKSLSPTDMGWLASTGGGGKVAVLVNGTKVTPDVRSLDFTGAGVTLSHSKTGGKVTINISGSSTSGGPVTGITGSYVNAINGLCGFVGLAAGAGLTLTRNGQTLSASIDYLAGGKKINDRKEIWAGDYILLQQYKFEELYLSTIENLAYSIWGLSGGAGKPGSAPPSAPQLAASYFFPVYTGVCGSEQTLERTATGITTMRAALYLDGVVTSVNGITGGITLNAGSNITITSSPFGGITISSQGGSGGGIVGNYVSTFNGLSGDVTGVSQITAGSGISVSTGTGNVTVSNTGVREIVAGSNITISESTGSVTISSNAGSGGGFDFYYQTTPPVSGITTGSRWMDSENGQEYIYINDGNSNQWVQPSVPNMIAATVNTVVGITSSAYTATQLDYYIGVSFGGKVTVTLPESPESGREIIVKDESGNAGKGPNRIITIIGSDNSTIDNRASAIINIDNAALHLIYRNGWRIV